MRIDATVDGGTPIRRHQRVFQRIHGHYRFMNAFWGEIGARLTGPVAIFLATATMTGLAITTAGFLGSERGVNPRVESWFDALYLAVTTMTGVGYGDIAPITRWGRVVAMLAMLFGTAIFAGFTALFASAILEVGRSERWTAPRLGRASGRRVTPTSDADE